MTKDGIYNNRTDLANLLGVAVQEMVSQGRALGITWNLRLGTVATAQGLTDLETQMVTVTLDGDTVPMSVDNFSGTPVAPGYRVAVVQVPPAGNFIIGAPTIGRPVGATATGSAQSIPNSVGTNLTWDSVTFDSGGFAGETPFTSWSIPTGLDGVYAISARFSLAAAGGTRNWITLDGSPTFPGIDARAFFGTGENVGSTTVVLPLSGGNTVFCQVFQTSGGPLNTAGKAFSIYRIG
jgi:hypothetical protein